MAKTKMVPPSEEEQWLGKLLMIATTWGSWLPLLAEFAKKVFCCWPVQRRELLETALDSIKGFEQVDES